MAAKPQGRDGVHVAASPEWVAWLNDRCAQMDLTRSQILAQAMQELARQNDWPPPPNRLGKRKGYQTAGV